MTRGIDLTFQVIARSKNRAALGLLESAFQSTSEEVRKLAGRILASRRAGQGLEAIIRHFDPSDHEIVELVNSNREKLIPGLHGAIVNEDTTLAQQAFRLAYTQEFYEVLPTLAAYCLGPALQEKSGLSLSADLFKFLDKFTAALEKNNPAYHRLLFNTVLPEFVKILVQKVKDYQFSRHELMLSVYLRIYPFLSKVGNDRDLYLQLRLPNSPVYASVYRRLINDSDTYLIQFFLRCLERFNPPPIITQVLLGRTDALFLEAIFKGIKKPLSLELTSNLANLPPLPWISQIDSIVSQIDAKAQCGLVLFLQHITLKGEELQTHLLRIFELGKDEGRVAALSALAAFAGADVDRLVWDASADENPSIQIEALNQLNARGIPGATSRIIQFAGSPHEEVRHAIHRLLPSFQFSRLMQTFDQLDDEQRRRMFNVVRSLDKNTPKEMSKILNAGETVLKTKALLCLDYCPDFVPKVEDALCNVLTDSEIPELRCKAASRLVAGRQHSSRMALVQAMHRDESPEVRDAAKMSLENRPTHWDQDGDK